MNSRTLRSIAIFLLCAASGSFAQDQGRSFHWSGKLPAEQILEIKNVNGDIEAESGKSDQVEVTADKSGPDADRVRIEVAQMSDGVVICAIYPGTSDKCSADWHASHVRGSDTKVHFTVTMPRNLRFTGTNINGDVIASGMGRFVRGETVNGAVRIETSAYGDAETVNGSIEARLGNSDWDGKLSFKSVNGSVRLELPDDLSADVNFKSLNGQIESDFPINVSGSFVGHSAKGRVGNGGRELSIETVNGSVELKKTRGGI